MDTIRSWLGRRASTGAGEAPVKMIVGLGNPGPEYARSRHNIGFQVADLLADRHGLAFDKFQKRARLAIGSISVPDATPHRVVLAKPMTYMNASGEAVGALAAFYKIAPADIVVLCDDLDLPVGRIRMRAGGSSGGQNGLHSIIKHLGTEAFPRLRVGIGRPPGQMDPASYVVQPFSPQQEAEMAFVRPRAADAIEVWLVHGIDAAMNQFNPNETQRSP